MDRRKVGLGRVRFPLAVTLLMVSALLLSINEGDSSLSDVEGILRASMGTVNVHNNDTEPPTITNVTHIPRYPQPNQRVNITARVVDNFSGVRKVFLVYREKLNYNWYGVHQYWGVYEWVWEPLTWNVYTEWITVEMNRVGDDTYSVELLELPYYSTVWYTVRAVDAAGNTAVSEVHVYHVVRGTEYVIYMQISTIISRVLYVAVGLVLVRGLGRSGQSESMEGEDATSKG